MERTPKLLIVGPDPKLPDEVKAALAGISDVRAVTHFAPDFAQGVEAARSRHPDLALVQMSTDLRTLSAFAEELAVAAPGTAVAALFSPESFGPDVSERDLLITALRAGVQDFLRRPLSSTDLRQLLDRMLRKSAIRPARLGKVVCFMSNKGGVGKSTLSVSTACALAARHPGRVLLIDIALQLGVCANHLDLTPNTTLVDAAAERDRLDETLLSQLAVPHECGLHLLAAPNDAVEGAQIDDDLIARVVTLGRRAYEYVIVDSYPLLDRVMMSVLDLCDRAYLVGESVVPTVLGLAKLVKLLDNLGFPADRQRVVLNRYTGSTGNLKATDVAQRLGRPVDHVLPYQKQVVVATNLGRPYILGASRFFSGFARGVDRIVGEIEHLEVQSGPARMAPSTTGTIENSKEPS